MMAFQQLLLNTKHKSTAKVNDNSIPIKHIHRHFRLKAKQIKTELQFKKQIKNKKGWKDFRGLQVPSSVHRQLTEIRGGKSTPTLSLTRSTDTSKKKKKTLVKVLAGIRLTDALHSPWIILWTNNMEQFT